MTVRVNLLILVSAAALAPCTLSAQVTLANAVSLTLTHNPKVKLAQADVAKASAALSETKDVYIPSVNVGAGLGDSYGYSPYPPTLFTFSAQSLVYSSSQRDYIRSARAGLEAANLALADAREAAAEDAANTFAALVHDQQREAVLLQQSAFSERLVDISADRLAAGRDNALDLNSAQLTRAQLRLALIHNETETATDQAHLAGLMGLSFDSLSVDPIFPASAFPAGAFTPGPSTLSSGVAAAFATARAKQQQARGDARFLYRPQVSLLVQYNRYATFTDSFKQLQLFNPTIPIGSNDEVYGIQINLPLFDKLRQAKARESAADAAHSLHSAEDIRLLALDGQSRTAHAFAELRARTEVLQLEQQRAQLQLDALVTELNAPPVEGRPPLSPKDEQNARIAEREKYLAVLDADFQLHQAEINLLRQTGGLEAWAASTPLAVPQNVQSAVQNVHSATP